VNLDLLLTSSHMSKNLSWLLGFEFYFDIALMSFESLTRTLSIYLTIFVIPDIWMGNVPIYNPFDCIVAISAIK